MPVSRRTASIQVERLHGLPFFSSIGESGLAELIAAMQSEARSDEEAQLAVSALLGDISRAGSTETNRVPSPGELRAWLQAQRNDKYDSPKPARLEFCGELAPGKTYLGHHPKTECTQTEIDLRESPPKFLIPARCVRGWVHWTIWVPVVPERIDEEGRSITQPYDYSAKCACQRAT